MTGDTYIVVPYIYGYDYKKIPNLSEYVENKLRGEL